MLKPLKRWWIKRQAERKLEAYLKTLSPERRAWANDLRKRLKADPKDAARILFRETQALETKQHRLTAKIHDVCSGLGL